MPRINTVEDFWAGIDVGDKDACWIWKRSRSPRGYGKTFFGGKDWRANRLAYYLTHKRLPKCVCHTCDNPPCCNPAHLFAGDHKANAIDRNKKKRGFLPKGERHHHAKLTNKIVMAIREDYAAGTATQQTLAAKYKVSQTHIGAIVRGKCWPHLPLATK